MEKTAHGTKHMPKQKTISNSNSISVLGIPVTDSRHNGKCNIRAFHEEIHAFEDWIFVRLSSLVSREHRMWDLIVSVPDHCLSFYFQK